MLAPPPSTRPRSRSTSAYSALRDDSDSTPANPFIVNTFSNASSNVASNTRIPSPVGYSMVSTPAGPVPITAPAPKVPTVPSTNTNPKGPEWVPFSVAVAALGITGPPIPIEPAVRPRSSSHGSPAKPTGSSFNPFKKALRLEEEPDETSPLESGTANLQWGDEEKASSGMGMGWDIGDSTPITPRDDVAILPAIEESSGTDSLQLTDVERCLGGPIGIVQEGEHVPTYFHHSQVVYRFVIRGLTEDKKGICKIESVLQVSNIENPTAFTKNVFTSCPSMFLGKGEVAGYVSYALSNRTLPYGRYRLIYQVTDISTKKSAKFFRDFTFAKAEKICIARVSFFADKGQTVYCSPSGFLGETKHFKIGCVGMHLDGNSVNTKISFNIRDLSLNEMAMTRPIEAVSKGEPFKSATSVGEPVTMASFSFKLTRMGNYVLCILAEDKNSKSAVQVEVPFTVYKP